MINTVRVCELSGVGTQKGPFIPAGNVERLGEGITLALAVKD